MGVVMGLAPAAHAGPVPAADAAAIRAMMEDSARGWSEGDLDRFMRSYAHGPDTAFVTSHGVVRGFDAIAARYRAAYARPGGGALGKLGFEVDAIDGLGPGYAVLYGRFRLDPPGGAPPQQGVFDLILHKEAAGWRIISDHTS